jgi:hypothetical protein
VLPAVPADPTVPAAPLVLPATPLTLPPVPAAPVVPPTPLASIGPMLPALPGFSSSRKYWSGPWQAMNANANQQPSASLRPTTALTGDIRGDLRA